MAYRSSQTWTHRDLAGVTTSEEVRLVLASLAPKNNTTVSTSTTPTLQGPSLTPTILDLQDPIASERLSARQSIAPLSTPPLPIKPANPQGFGGGGGGPGGSSTPRAGGGGGGPTGGGGGPGLVNASQFVGRDLDTSGVGQAFQPDSGSIIQAAKLELPANAPIPSSPLTDVQTAHSMTAAAHATPLAPLHHHPTPPPPHRHGHGHGHDSDPLYVLDMNTGETIPVNTPLNSFSMWSENLLAQVSGATVSSYSWDVSQAPDLTNVSGTSTANLQGTWASFTGPARTDTISVTETNQDSSQLTQTMTFLVSGTDSPAYSASRPTSSSTWPSVITPDQLSSGQATQTAGSYAKVGLTDGSVQTSFSMPVYNPNTTPVSLDYNSTTANAQPIFLAEYQLPVGQAVPSTITAQLTFNNTPLATVTYDTSTLNPGDIVQIALQANATGLNTGRYPWAITITNGSTPTNYSGNVDIVNQANSPFGAGWSLDNVEQLVSVSGGMMLVNPDGTSLYFASNGQGGFTSPANDFSTLTYSNGVYTRTLTDGTKINFNSSGQQTSTVDRDGNTTTFTYNGSGQLTTITDMNGQVTTLAYNGSGLLSSITDPAKRTATLAYTGNQLTSITDPVNDVWQYAYDASNDLTTLTDPNNNATTFAYNFADRVSSVTRADNTTEQLNAEQMNGLAAPGTGTPSNPAPAVLLAAGDQAQFTDANNNVWTTDLDWLGFGLAAASMDPLYDASLNYINANGLVWLSADALGRRARDFFDNNGNITEEVAPDDTTQQYQYNQFSEVTKYTDQENNVTQHTYNSKGDLTQTTDALGDITNYVYNTAGLVTSTTDPNNNTTTHAYNTLNELTSTTNALSGVTSYTYDTAGNLASTTDARGFVSTFSYDAMNRLTSKTLPDTPGVFSTYTYAYDKVGNQLSSTDPLNHTTTYGYNAVNEQTSVTNPLSQTTTYGYDAVGNLFSITDPLGDQTTYGYDTANRRISVKDALGNTTTYIYDPAGEQVGVTDPMGNVTVYSYTPRGEVATESLLVPTQGGGGTGSGSPAVGSNAAGGGLYRLTPSTTVNHSPAASNGGSGSGSGSSSAKPMASMGGSGCYSLLQQINYLYYGCGCPEAITVVNTDEASGPQQSISGNMSGILQWNGWPFSGAFTGSLTNNSLNLTDYGEVQVPGQTPTGYGCAIWGDVTGNNFSGTFYFFSSAGDARGTVSGTINGSTLSGNINSDGVAGSFTGTISGGSGPDSAMKLSSAAMLSPDSGGGGSTGETTSYQRDALHQVTSITDAMGNTTSYSYDKDGNTLSITDPNDHTTNYAYNALNNMISKIDPLGDTTSYGYDADGNQTSVTNPLGNVSSTTYDAQGRVLAQTDTNGGVTKYSYDLAGNLLSLTDPDNNITSYTYDAANELVSTTNPLGYVSTDAYNAAGELTSTTDADGRTINYGYNAAGQETSETWVGANYTANYAYDADSQLTTESDPYSNYSYTYDALGNVTSADNSGTPGVPTVTLDYGYDSYGNRTSLSDSLGGSLSYSYDADNRLTGLGLSVNSTQDAQLAFGYDTASNLTSLTRTAPSVSGDTITSSYSYDTANRLTNITHTDTTKSLTLASYSYGYDKASDLINYQDNNNSSLNYGYDKAGQLLSASGTLNGQSYSVSYSYDANGNRRMPGYQTGTGNELQSDGMYNYTYDKDGNTLTQTNIATGYVTYYNWDYRNRLTEVKQEDNHGNVLNDETFTYDVNGNRIGVSLNGVQQLLTVYDGSNPYMDFNGSGTLLQRYLTNPNALSQFYGQVSASGTVQWFLTDNLNSVRLVVDSSGNVLDAITYDPYGIILSQTNAANAPRFLFAGGGI